MYVPYDHPVICVPYNVARLRLPAVHVSYLLGHSPIKKPHTWGWARPKYAYSCACIHEGLAGNYLLLFGGHTLSS